MANKSQRYRGFDIVKLPGSMARLTGRPYAVFTWRGERLSAHSCLSDAKCEIDRILKGNNLTDASEYGCPI